MPELITRRDGPVATILFSNPAKMNAMSYDMWRAVPQTLAELDREKKVRKAIADSGAPAGSGGGVARGTRPGAPAAPSVADTIGKVLGSPLMKSLARSAGTQLARGLFGTMGLSTSRRRRLW